MKEVAILILNYITWELTVELIKDITKSCEISSLCDVIIVDNCSPNDSYHQLENRKGVYGYKLIQASSNEGFASGNNIGLKYAHDKGYQYVLVANNDITFTEENIINKLLKILMQNSNIAVVSPDIYSPDGYLYNRDAVKPSLWDMTLGAISYRKKGRGKIKTQTEWFYTYRPQGCCMLVNMRCMKEINYMDEYTFLYCEEIILAERLIEKGYRCACCTRASVIHTHSHTVKLTLAKWKFIKANVKSFDYYLNKYRNFNLLKRIWCDLFYVGRLFATKQV